MVATLLDEDDPQWFPDPNASDDHGLVAVSESLGPARLLAAYGRGIFPWMKLEAPPHLWCWFSPNPRMVLYPSQMRVSRSLKKAIESNRFAIRIDQDFRETMRACARSPRPAQESTWIEEDMIDDYCELHRMGIAHSIEAFNGEHRVGGLYGLAMGKVFFGESMFHLEAEASKVCLAHLVKLSLKYGISMIDCQARTSHLEKMGAVEIHRGEFNCRLMEFLEPPDSVIPWLKLRETS